MTAESKWLIDPEDILAVRFECGNCRAAVSVPIKAGISTQVNGIAAGSCRFCKTPWEITPNSAEHKALQQFAAGLEEIAATMEGRPLKVRLEVRGEGKL